MQDPIIQIPIELAQIESKIYEYKKQELKLFVSSSFQSHSIPLLHIISKIDNTIPVFFLDTGFHFPETMIFRDEVAEKLGIRVHNLKSPIPKPGQINSKGYFHFSSDIDLCCYMNKTLPMESVLRENDVWISGLRKDQNANRESLSTESRAPGNTLRYHPMLDWNSNMVDTYTEFYNLPRHPLNRLGYRSIGCLPCTKKPSGEIQDREGRWVGLNKTECGLHTDLIEK